LIDETGRKSELVEHGISIMRREKKKRMKKSADSL